MYEGPIIDCDVHHEWKSNDEILPFMARGWREYVKGPGRDGDVPMSVGSGHVNPHGVFREDEFPADGGFPGSDPNLLVERLLDRYGITRAILTYATALFAANLPNPFFAAEIARAANDWTRERWLPVDDRLYSSIVVTNQLPDVAAAEIRRMASDPRFVQVVMANNALTMPFGHPLMDPVHRAAAECGVPIALHAFSAGGIAPSSTGLGFPNYYIEYHALGCQNIMTHLVSFLVNGVFERYPDLRLVLTEGGCAWIPSLIWRLDEGYERMRREVPSLKRRPSEYFRDHVRMTTQPLEAPDDPTALSNLLESVGAADLLHFATDYPHWDADDPLYVQDLLPDEWQERYFYRNAAEAYGWKPEELLDEHRAGTEGDNGSRVTTPAGA